MPLPPMHYVKQYSDDCVKRGLAPPPPNPLQPNESYSMFGHQFTAEDSIIASLESQGIRRLYSAKDVDRKKELRKVCLRLDQLLLTSSIIKEVWLQQFI